MLTPAEIREAVSLVNRMDRDELIARLRTFDAPFPIDFTDQYLQNIPIEQLRHVFAGLCIHCNRLPQHVMPLDRGRCVAVPESTDELFV